MATDESRTPTNRGLTEFERVVATGRHVLQRPRRNNKLRVSVAFNRPRCTVTPCGKVTDEKRDGVVHVHVDRARISGRIAERQNYIVYVLQRDNYTVVTDDGQRVSALQNCVVPTYLADAGGTNGLHGFSQ